MGSHVLGIATEVIVMTVVISVILLFLGIGALVLIHVCIVGRTLRNGVRERNGSNNNNNTVERESLGSTSMSRDDIEKLPCFDFVGKEKGSISPAADCAVCLENFRAGERCRLLPTCNHSFHAECVDLWLLRTPVCPVCRAGADFVNSGLLCGENVTGIQIDGGGGVGGGGGGGGVGLSVVVGSDNVAESQTRETWNSSERVVEEREEN